MATRKNGAGPSGEIARPRIKSSHEKVKAASRPRRAVAAPVRARADADKPDKKGVKKVRRHETPSDEKGIWSVASQSARETASAIAVAALEKLAMGVEILDVAGKVDYADFLVIMTGRSDRHAQSLAQGIEETLKKAGIRAVAVEGLPHATWVLMDFGDVVVHVFQNDTRQIYDIEGLWLDAKRLPVPVSEPVES